MSGPKPRQQQSRSGKDGWKDLEVFSKEEVIEIAKSVSYDDLTFLAGDFDLGEGEEDDEHGEG
jgi:hypothetical protein